MAVNIDFRVNQGLAVTTTATIEGKTQSISTVTGALIVAGGSGIGGNLYVGGTTNIANTLTAVSDVIVSSTTPSVNITSGALTVAGGVGISGQLNVGGDLRVTGVLYGAIVGNITTASGLANGSTGQIPYQTNAGVTGFFGPGVNGQLLVSAGTTATGPVFTNTSSIWIGRADIATNIVNGSSGQLHYQSNPSVTAMVSAGAAGQLLVSAGSTSTGPVFTNTSSIFVGFANAASTINIINDTASATVQYVTFVSTSTGSTGLKTAYTSGLTYIPGSGFHGLNVATPTAILDVGGSVKISGVTTITNTTTAISTETGALQIVGGVGIGGNAYIGGFVNIANTLSVANTATFNTDAVINGTANASSTSTGALKVTGGVGIGGNAYIGGTVNIANTLSVANTATFNTDILINGTSNATSTITGALQVIGGVGVGGDLYVGGTVFGAITGIITTATNIAGGTLGQVPYQSTTGTTAFFGPGTAGQFLKSNGAAAPSYVDTGTIFIGYSVTATHLATGTSGQIVYQIAPGVTGFVSTSTIGNVLVSNGINAPEYQNTLALTGTTVSTSTATGALQVVGGVGIGGNAYIGGTVNVANTLTVTNSTSATSTTTGALQVVGGVGIGGNLYVGGDIRLSGTVYGVITGVISTATNIAGGTIGQIPYQSNTGTTSFFGPGTAGQFLKSNGAGIPSYVNTSTIFVGNAVTAINIAIGTNGQLVYQVSPGVTGFVNTGTAGTVLVSNGSSVPTYNNTLTLAGTTVSTSTNTGALQVAGGVGIGGNLYVGGNSNIIGNETITGDLTVNGGDILTTAATFNLINTTTTIVNFAGSGTAITIGAPTGYTTIRNVTTISNITAATSTTTGALVVSGGAGIGGNLYVGNLTTVLSTLSSTSSVSQNALYVAGGVGIGKTLFVTGEAYFQNNVTFSGTTTYVLTTNTVYTDNIIELHYANTTTGWTVNDGKDIGLRFHYYDTADSNAFLGRDNTTGYLEWLGRSSGDTASDVTGTNGTFRLGSIILTDTTITTTPTTGALTVAGGVGIGGDLRVSGVIYGLANVTGSITTSSNLAGGTIGQVPFQVSPGLTSFFGPGTSGQLLMSVGASITGPVFTNTASIYVGYATGAVTAINIAAGNAGQLPYQSAPGSTSFVGTGTTGQVLVSAGTTSTGPVFQNTLTLAGTTISSSTNTGALQVVGGVGIGGNLNVGGNANIAGITTVTNTTNATSTTTGALQIIGGAGIGSNLYVGGNANIAGITTVTNATNASSTNTGALQVSGGVGVGSNLYVGGNANIAGITTVTNATNASSTNTGALQVSGGVGIGGTLYVGGNSNIIGNETITGDLTVNGGDILTTAATFNLINTAATTVNFAGAGTTITIGATTGNTTIRNATTVTSITSATSTATGALVVRGGVGIGGSVYVGGFIYGILSGLATTATNIAGGTAGQLPIQVSPGLTAFISTGSVGNLLQQQTGNTATFVSTATLLVGFSVTATNIAAGTAGQLHYQSAPGITSFAGPGTAGNVLVSNGTSAPTYNNTLTLAGTTQSTSTFSGALQVAGGVGIGGNLYVGGIIVGGGDIFGSITTASNIAGGSAGFIPIQVASGITSFISTGSVGNLLQQQTGNTATFVSTATLLVGFAVTATNIAAGTNGQLHYQISPGVTGFVSTSAIGNVLVSNGTSIPLYQNTLILAGATVSTNPTSGAFQVVGGAGIGGNLNVGGYTTIAGITTVTNITSATSTATGALIVAGGVGVGGSVYVGGDIRLLGVLYGTINGTITTATNIASGTIGQVPFQSNTGTTAFFGPGTAGQLLVSAGASATGPVFTNTSSIWVGYAKYAITATNIAVGTAGQLVYQSAPGVTGFVSTGTAGNVLVSNGTGVPTYNNTLTLAGNVASTNTTSGALQVVGGVGIGGTLYVGGNSNIAGNETITGDLTVNGGDILTTAATFNLINTNATAVNFAGAGTTIVIGAITGSTTIRNATTVTNSTSATSTSTGALVVGGGVGIAGNLFVGGTIFGGIVGGASTATNIANGNVAQIPYQTAPGLTAFIGTGTLSQILVSQGTTSTGPVFTNTSSIWVGYSTFAVTATNIAAGTAGQLHYQSAPGVTSFAGPGTANQILVSAGTSAPVYTNTASIYVGNAVTATNLRAGVIGAVPYQSGVGSTAFLVPGTAGYVLSTQGAGFAPTWITSSGLSAGSATTATNLLSGTTGQVPFQVSPGITSFFGPGTAGQLLMSANASGTGPVYTNTASIYVGRAVLADTATIVTITNDVASATPQYITFVSTSTGNTGIKTAATTGMVYVPSTGNVGIGTAAPTTLLTVGPNPVAPLNSSELLQLGRTADAYMTISDGTGRFLLGTTAGLPFIGTQNATPLVLRTTNLERVRITASGSVGIGIAAPTSTLHVVGTTLITGVTTITNTTTATSTVTGALIVAGGIGVGDSVYVKNRVGFVNTSNVSAVYQVYNAVTNSLDTVFA